MNTKTESNFTHYRITGCYYNSTQRFAYNIQSAHQASMVNLWRGSIYGVLETGKKKLIKRIYN